jgi:hypothetical protein
MPTKRRLFARVDYDIAYRRATYVCYLTRPLPGFDVICLGFTACMHAARWLHDNKMAD